MACKSLPGYFPQSVAQRQYTAGENQRIMWARLLLWISRQKTAALPHIFMLVRECLTLGSVTLGASQCAVRKTTKFHGCLRDRISCDLYRKYGFSLKNISKPQTKQNPVPVSKCTKPGCALLPCRFFVYPVCFLSTETMASYKQNWMMALMCFVCSFSLCFGRYIPAVCRPLKVNWHVCRYREFLAG